VIKGIVFDFTGVVGSDGGGIWFEEVHPNPKSRLSYIREIANKSDLNEITSQEFALLLSKETEVPPHQIWPSIFEKITINNQILKLAIRLKKSYQVGMLTNYNDWFHDISQKYHLEKYFEPIVISYKYKVVKPQAEAFYNILSIMKVKPREALFIDDIDKNIKSAQKLGINSILYSTYNKLVEDLSKLWVKLK